MNNNFSPQEKQYSTYLKKILFIFLLVFGTLLLNFIFIERSYENASYKKIVRIQSNQHSLYGSALNPNDLGYKIALATFRKSKILVLGSSRVMQLREDVFIEPLTNAGGVFSTLNEGKYFVETLFKNYKPQLILFGIDFWWFHKNYHYDERRRFLDETAIYKDKLIKPFLWLKDGKISPKEYFSTIFFGPQANKYSSHTNMGIHAIMSSNGFRTDGSYLDTESIFNLKNNRTQIFKKEEIQIIEGTNERTLYGLDEFVDPKRWQLFLDILNIFKENNINYILYLAPVAPTLISNIKDKHKDAFVKNLSKKLQTLPVEFYDFTDTRDLSQNNDEFLDGWHSGDILYLRILRKIQQNKNSILKPYLIKPELLNQIIEQNSGKLIF